MISEREATALKCRNSECFFFRKYHSKVVKRLGFAQSRKVRNHMHFHFACTDQSDPSIRSICQIVNSYIRSEKSSFPMDCCMSLARLT